MLPPSKAVDDLWSHSEHLGVRVSVAMYAGFFLTTKKNG